jgi:SAM-dependent methyltransferase
MRLAQLRQLLSYHAKWASRFAAHDVQCVFGRALHDLRIQGFGEFRRKRVLDLGCGPMYACALQCAACGAEVTALDARYVHPGRLPVVFGRALVHDGFEAAAKLMVRRVLFAPEYYRVLESEAHKDLRAHESEIEFVTCDPARNTYPLASCSFDLVVANAVLEHVTDVFLVAKEIRRVLKPGGYFHAIIHNFYSLSGGHCPEWAYPDTDPSSRVPPWDHLREGRFPAACFLNRLKPEEYYESLSQYFDVLLFEGRDINHEPGGVEGEKFLAGSVAVDLAHYSRELLLTRCWCAVCRRDQRDAAESAPPNIL